MCLGVWFVFIYLFQATPASAQHLLLDCIQVSFLEGFGGPFGEPGLKLGQLFARQVPCLQ